MVFDEIDADNPAMLILSCANGDGTLYLARQHVVGIKVDWTIQSGVVLVLTSVPAVFEVRYDERDQGEQCASDLAEALAWLERDDAPRP